MCQEVRDEIEAVLGADASVAELLTAMCDCRLVATPWLNQASAFPLHSLDLDLVTTAQHLLRLLPNIYGTHLPELCVCLYASTA